MKEGKKKSGRLFVKLPRNYLKILSYMLAYYGGCKYIQYSDPE